MTRTAAHKALYFFVVIVAAILAFVAVDSLLHDRVALGLGAVAILLSLHVAGFVQRRFLSELLSGLHHLVNRDFAKSKAHSERFLAQLEAQPWRGKFIALGLSSYSRNAEAMARNNLGAAMTKLGEFDPARAQLSRAIELDPKGPLSYHNMGLLLLNTATFGEAVPWFEKSRALGFTGGWSDDVVTTSQQRNAARVAGEAADAALPSGPASVPPVSGAFVIELINDDVTPMEFVIATLERLFAMTGAEALRIMLAVHREGSAPCAGFDTEAAAKAKADALSALARAEGFPLAARVVAK